MKFCDQCGTETDRDKTGRCRACRNKTSAAYKAANPEKNKVHNAAYRLKNLEQERKRVADWRANNSDQAKVTALAWRSANLEKNRKASAEWRLRNTPKLNPEAAAKRYAKAAVWRDANRNTKRDCDAAWRAANPDTIRTYGQNRRAREREAGGRLSRGLASKLFKLQKGKCLCCGQPLGDKFHLDHVKPLALGGTNTDDNIQLLRAICNLQKNDKHPIDFMQSRGFLL